MITRVVKKQEFKGKKKVSKREYIYILEKYKILRRQEVETKPE